MNKIQIVRNTNTREDYTNLLISVAETLVLFNSDKVVATDKTYTFFKGSKVLATYSVTTLEDRANKWFDGFLKIQHLDKEAI